MLKEIYTAALGMMPQQTKLEVTANNIANAKTTGFKSDGVFQQQLIEARQNLNHVKGDIEQDDSPVSRYTNFAPGGVERTDNPLDIAIDGPGFFMVLDENGDEFLTRAGRFTLDHSGRVITPDGKDLVGDGGPISISDPLLRQGEGGDDEPLKILIKPNGDVFVNEEEIGRITIVNIEDPQTLERRSGTQFALTEESFISTVPADEVRVKQGHIENSNVNIIDQMVEMIELQRMFSLGQKVITTNDATIERSIETGRFT